MKIQKGKIYTKEAIRKAGLEEKVQMAGLCIMQDARRGHTYSIKVIREQDEVYYQILDIYRIPLFKRYRR